MWIFFIDSVINGDFISSPRESIYFLRIKFIGLIIIKKALKYISKCIFINEPTKTRQKKKKRLINPFNI